MRAWHAVVCAVLAVASAACSRQPTSSTTTPFPAGGTLRIIVGYSAGGGYDINARLVARYISRHLGTSSAIVQNMPGAGGLLATRHLATVAATDGLTIGLLASNNLDPNGAGADVSGATRSTDHDPVFRLLGSPAPVQPVCVFSARSGIASLAQWQQRTSTPPRLGTPGPGSISFIVSTLLRDVAHLPVSVVSGYEGSGDTLLALGSGEVDGFCASWETLGPAVRRSPDLTPVLRLSTAPVPGFDTVPDLLSVVADPQARHLLDVGIYAWNDLGRVFVAPRGVAPERLEALRSAIAHTMADASYRRDADTAGIVGQPIPAATLDRAFARATGDRAAVTALHALLAAR